MKNFLKKYGVLLGVVILVVLFVVLSILLKGKEPVKKVMKDDLNTWLTDTKEGYVVTVIGQTTCSHCLNFKPIMQSVYDDHDITVYWFEANKMTSEDYEILKTTFELQEYVGTPYTFITYNGEFVDYISGESNKSDLISKLKNANVIE